ncbi:Defensin-like protein 4 [Zostera marina]|uniref:Defensin-like protein 4 n=1 Tax=Zostera marina TaxID=29655 RepID=A0A0K9NJR0_ZOSMR|nr:Defensin-like protein 4 [Zostera marina]
MTQLRFFSAFLFLVLLITTTGDVGLNVAEAKTRTCMSQSHSFKGVCASKSNCKHVCHTEGFPEGDCRGFRRRCFCVRPC